jgi:predicted TIM-barrel fold metal-dependent hydrolase
MVREVRMVARHIQRQDLIGKVVDVHAHVGLNIKAYAETGFPYCSSIEDLFYRQSANSVDCSVVFPITPELYFDIPHYAETGELCPAARPLSPGPYVQENRMLLNDVFRFCPERASHFLPFVSVDPGRKIQEQLASLRELEQEFPIYGVKISPVACQSKVTKLLEEGEAFLEFAHQRNWPILFHVTVDPKEEFSGVEDTFKVVERHPELRYCLAHCIGFHRGHLDRARALPNVWVDTSALKIQVDLIFGSGSQFFPEADRLECDSSDHRKVMQALVEKYPRTIVWGSDTPYHSYITRRLQGDGYYYEFRLKGTYEQEKAAWDVLSPEQRQQLNLNALEFIFG